MAETNACNGLLSLEHVIFAGVRLEKRLAIAAYDPECVTADDLMMAAMTIEPG